MTKTKSTTDGGPGRTREMHSAKAPVPDPVPDTGTARLLQEQAAALTARSGSVDAPGMLAGEEALLHDVVIDHEAQLLAGAREQEGSEAEQIGACLVLDAENGELTPATEGAAGSQHETRKRLRAVRRRRKAAEKEADRCRRVLDGREPDVDGGHRAGAPLAAQSAREGRAVLRRRHLDAAAKLVALLGLEGFVTASSIYAFLRTSDYFTAAAVAVSALASLTIGPWILGRSVADWRAGAGRGASRLLLMVPVGVVWLAVGVTLAWVRVNAEQQAYAQRQAATQQGLLNGAAIGSGTTHAATAVVYRIDGPLEVLFWTAVLVGLGVVVATWEAATHNPARERELEARVRVWELFDLEVGLSGRQDRIVRQVAHQRADMAIVDRMWRKEVALLMLRGRLLKAVFSEQLALESADPEMTLAIEDRVARTRAESAAATRPVVSIRDGRRAGDEEDAS